VLVVNNLNDEIANGLSLCGDGGLEVFIEEG
jgi:hypothetical protein